jgi:glucokinase
MYLGIEIGGTKLQLGVGRGDGELLTVERFTVDSIRGAGGILERIESAGARLIAKYGVTAVGIGFGGPCDPATGRTLKSHQIGGWDDFPLADWVHRVLGLPATIGNDADVAGLAEAHYGAGRGLDPVFYVTVGTGIGGGLIVGGQIYRGSGLGAAEIGHLRPGLSAESAEQTVESLAAGPAIAAAAQARLAGPVAHRLQPLLNNNQRRRPEDVRQHLINEEEAHEEFTADLLDRCDGDVERLSAKIIGQAATDGNGIALDVLHSATTALGWGIAQVVTLLGPQAVILGGGVSLLGEGLFFTPLRAAVDRYVFPPFLGTYQILPAELGEEMVVHGALALAAGMQCKMKNAD